MSSMAVAHRKGMDFCGDTVDFTLDLSGSTLESAREFYMAERGGPKGALAILKDGLYYVCDGLDPDTDRPFTEAQLTEIKNHFDDGAVMFF